MNEIDQEKSEVKNKIKLIISKDLREDIVKDDSLKSNVHIFIDEFVVNDVDDLRTLDEVCEKINVENHMWVTVAKASVIHSESFKNWLEEKKKAGFIEPSLNFQLRNTKEIIAFENSLAPQKKSLAENTLKTGPESQSDTNESDVQPALDSNPDPDGSSQTTQPVSTNQLQPFDLPTQGWPFTELKIPDNLCSGKKVHVETHKTSEPLEDAMDKCFKVLNNLLKNQKFFLAKECLVNTEPFIFT